MNDHYDPCLKEYRLGLIEDAAKSSSGTWHFVRGDLADRELVNCVFHEEKPSVVVNLAAQAGGRYSITNPALKEKSLPENMPGGEERKRFG